MDICDILRKEGSKWIYDIKELKRFIEEISINFTSKEELQKYIGVYKGFLNIIEKKHNIKFDYNFSENKRPIYQSYDWCYQKYIIEQKTYEEMANEIGVTKRVIQKWCCEKHKLNKSTIKKYLKLNDMQNKLIKASILGDGHIAKKEDQPYFTVGHAENQKEYLYWKYNILSNLCNKKPSVRDNRVRSFNGKEYECQRFYHFNTRVIEDLKIIRGTPTIDILKELDEFMFSIFILDDGSKKNVSWEICLADYNEEEKKIFIDVCINKLKLNPKIKKDRRYILFDSISSRKIDGFILNSIPNNLDIVKQKVLKGGNANEYEIQ